MLFGTTSAYDVTAFRYALNDVKERYDGMYLLRTYVILPSSEIERTYRGLCRIENAFQELKSGLEVRLCHHWTSLPENSD
jgi:hypothetical protein